MLLLTSCLIDVLSPEDKEDYSFYNNFLSQYSSITVSTMVSQLYFLAETYKDTTQKELDKEVNDLIFSLAEGAERRRNNFRALSYAAMLNPGNLIQENENRTFISNLFSEYSKKNNMSNTQMLLRSLNQSAFLNYFILIEDCIKDLYFNTKEQQKNKFLKGSQVISIALKEVLNHYGIFNEFNIELEKRSKFFIGFESLEKMWNLVNFIRNRLMHYNGYYDEKAKNKFHNYFSGLIKLYNNRDDMSSSISLFINYLEETIDRLDNSGLLIIDDALENIIRNIAIFIMESLYICKNKFEY